MYKPSFSTSNLNVEVPQQGDTQQDFSSALPEILPSEKRYVGKYSKYFAYHVSDHSILEISPTVYNELKSNSPKYDNLLYRVYSLKWDSTTPIYDEQIGKFTLEGSNSRNLKQVEKLEKELPGIKDYLVTRKELFI